MPDPDPRLLPLGSLIPSEGYADQPYIVRTGDDAWLCVVTTGPGDEGQGGQHVIALRSTDHGRTWSAPVDVEPSDGPEASYAVLFRAPYGRIYCFYNYNGDNRREILGEDRRTIFRRVDSQGHYVFRYSDDDGRTWSAARQEVPVRLFDCDRANVYGGAVRFFWNVGRPLLLDDGGALLVLHKVGAMGEGFFAQSEGCFLRSDNLATERDPARLRFETLPEGEVGLRTPTGGGRISEEQSVVQLSDGTLFCVYRTIDGSPACAWSADRGRHWTPPAYMTVAPGGRRVKHPRAANFVWRCANGRYLYWFHNHGGKWYDDRNPAWLMAGREVETPAGRRLAWSQPEIALYDDDPIIRFSYPDLIEEDGRFWLTETQKRVGRVHALSPALVAGLFAQHETAAVPRDALRLELSAPADGKLSDACDLPALPLFTQADPTRIERPSQSTRAGFTLELSLVFDTLAPGQVVLDARAPDGAGFCLRTTERETLELTLSDGRTVNTWDTDPGVLRAGARHTVTAIVDGGPRLILFVVDGVLGDGGTHRAFGWGRFSPHLQHARGAPRLQLAPRLDGRLMRVRLFERAWRVSEAVASWRAGLPE